MILQIFLVIIILYILVIFSREGFSTQSERADKIAEWIRGGWDSYASYKSYVGGTIVEYERVLGLKASRGNETLTSEQIKKIL